MKQKLDFVTNSSSTSVVMWGVYLDNYEMSENEKLMEKVKELTGVTDAEDDDLDYQVEQALEKVGLETHFDYNGDGLYIGKSPFSIGEDETPRQFKEKLQNQLRELGIENKVEEIVESWFDG